MKKILYLMNVNWGWIKQRPHFLAEELSGFFQVDAYFQKHYRKRKDDNKTIHQLPHLNLHELFRLPKDEKVGILRKINYKLINAKLKRAEKNADFIWYSKPDHVKWLAPEIKTKGLKIYDCMDDMLAFPEVIKNNELEKSIFESEKSLIDYCDILFASSDYLADKLKKRYSTSKKIRVVNNALHLYSQKEKYVNTFFDKLKLRGKIITYIGTIAEWFDFDKVIRALDKTEKCSLVLFGPTTVAIPVHPKIIHLGTLEHKFVADVMDRSDVLILPFVVSELIKAVNPVKMYEYISSGNLVIASCYGETMKFESYAHLYSNESELVDLFVKLDKNELNVKQGKSICLEYAKLNTWKARAETIEKILNSHA